MATTTTTRTAIYCRISDDRKGERAGVERQEKECRAHARRLGWTVTEVLVDNSISAYNGKHRPAYAALLSLLERGDVTGVLAWHPDRLHRSPRELEAYIDAAERHGVTTHTVQAGDWDLSTPSGRAIARTLGAWSRYESEHKGQRIAAAARQRALEGKPHGGSRPFGYRKGGMDLEPTEAVVIDELFERFVVGRESLRSLAMDLNARGISTSTGRRWSSLALRAILDNCRYAGLRPHKGEPIADAAWPAIVPVETWQGARAILSDPARRTSPGNTARYIGSGLYVCGVCGRPALRVSNSGQHRPSYRCVRPDDDKGGVHITRNAARLDEYVESLLIARLERPDAQRLRRSGADRDTRALVTEQAALRERADEAARLFAAGSITAAQLARISQEVTERNSEVAAKMAARTGSAVAGVVGPDIRERWPSLPLETRRAVLDTLVTVTVLPGAKRGQGFDPEAIRFEWK